MNQWWLLVAGWAWSWGLGEGSKYNQRVFEDVAAIDYADPTKNGFRVIMSQSFINRHLKPGSLPTIFVTAVPLHAGEERFTNVLYPESKLDDKLLVNIHRLRAQSWYYVCLEWENINRHNETTGTSCKIYRTLDRFGKTASTDEDIMAKGSRDEEELEAVEDVELRQHTDSLLRFRLKYGADFPVRLTAYLNGGQTKVAAQSFVLKERAVADVVFPFLEDSTLYGQLCVIEEPLVTAYTAMGRLISGLRREKCYFDGLKTKSGNSVAMATEPQRAAFHRRLSAAASSAPLLPALLLPALLSTLLPR